MTKLLKFYTKNFKVMTQKFNQSFFVNKTVIKTEYRTCRPVMLLYRIGFVIKLLEYHCCFFQTCD